jgi:EAL domain-containing protein (putative c-di-GMP-specific phosphodiesterase class I)/ActR/RegA family two-component response regulator
LIEAALEPDMTQLGQPASDARPRILLVDDDVNITTSMKLALRREPFQIACANSGAQALELLGKEQFDVVVSDERMPGMQGSELLAVVRAKHPEVIRIILSGQASVEAAIRAINSAEIYRFLIKPHPPEELALTIWEALRVRSERRGFEQWRAAQAGNRAALEAGFDRALAQLSIEFEPIMWSDPPALFGYEAKVKVEVRELNERGALFAAATELGRVLPLCRKIRELVALRIPDAPPKAAIFLELHPEELSDPTLLLGEGPLARHAARIVLEITERESLYRTELLEEKISALRALGYRIAENDLGSGYAGLTSLARLSPEFIKLDMQLVRDIQRSPTRQKLVAAMVGLARELGVKSLADGVETSSEFSTLNSLGCKLVQGFLFGESGPKFPLPEPREIRDDFVLGSIVPSPDGTVV